MLYFYHMIPRSEEESEDLVFKALAAPVRRRILDALRQEPRTTGAVCALFPDLDRTTVLQHLRVLERAELVTARRVGRERHLTLAPLPIKRIHDRWIGEYARAAVDLLARLDDAAWPEAGSGTKSAHPAVTGGDAAAGGGRRHREDRVPQDP